MAKTLATPNTPPAASRRRDPRRSAGRPAGSVAFVGTGPGDPGLLTVRAGDLITHADVVITEVASHTDLLQSLLGDRIDKVQVVDGGFGEDGVPLTPAARAKLV